MRPVATILLLTLTGMPLGARGADDPIEEVLRETLGHHPALASAQATLRAAQAAVEAEAWFYFPLVTASLQGSRTATPSLSLAPEGTALTRSWDASLALGLSETFPVGTRLSLELTGDVQQRDLSASAAGTAGGRIGPGYGLGARLTLVQPLLRGLGRQWGESGLRQARLEEEAARIQAETVVSQVLRDVLTAWWAWQGAVAAREVARQSLELAVRQREEAGLRVQRGTLAPADLLAFETAAASREEDLVQTDALALERLSGLFQAMGLPLDRRPLPTWEPPDDLSRELGIPTSEEGADPAMIPEALARAPALLAAEVSLRRVQDRALVAGEASRPRLDLQVWAEGQGLGNRSLSSALGQFGRAEAGGVFLGFSFEAPVLSRRHRAEQAQVRAQVQAADADLQAVRVSVEASAASLLHQVEAARRRLDLARKTAEMAEKQALAERRRFEAGTAIAVQVLQAEDALRQARLRVLQARFDLQGNLTALRHLSGRLLPWIRDRYPRLPLPGVQP